MELRLKNRILRRNFGIHALVSLVPGDSSHKCHRPAFKLKQRHIGHHAITQQSWSVMMEHVVKTLHHHDSIGLQIYAANARAPRRLHVFSSVSLSAWINWSWLNIKESERTSSRWYWSSANGYCTIHIYPILSVACLNWLILIVTCACYK